MPSVLHLDFESFSACDLKARGLDNYAKDPSTGIHCLAYAFDDEPVAVLTSWGVTPETRRIANHIFEMGVVVGHNVAFELAIWNNILAKRFLWPDLLPRQCRCTMAMCYAMALPGALEDAAPSLGLEVRKDAVGKRIMLKWCKPKLDGSMWKAEEDPAQFQALLDYCAQDVEVERALHGRMMELSPDEQDLWTLDYHINQRGVLVDLQAVQLGLEVVAHESRRLDLCMLRATNGAVGKCSEVKLLVKWIRTQGVEMKGAAKAEVLDALVDEDLPANVRLALELRKEAAKSSTAKILAMKERSGPDGRLRGLHQYHGAATGRWAGRGVQIQNMPRPRPTTKPQDVEQIIAHLGQLDYLDTFYGPPLDALADCVRGLLVAPKGKDLVAVDFSAVEARVLAWLAGEEHVLQAFRDQEDIYKVAAAAIYRVSKDKVDKFQRQIGKVAVLALGYGGGPGAFQSMAKNYNVKVSEGDAEDIKLAWRLAHRKIVEYWYDLEGCAIAALEGVGPISNRQAGHRAVTFVKRGSFLWCKLPSGRVLCYPYPELREVETPWGEMKTALTYMTVVSNLKAKILPDPAASGTWKRVSTYGGSLAENVTQAVARDLLAEALKRLEAAGFYTVMHVHDEAVVEIESGCHSGIVKELEALMAEPPSWATGLPLAAEGWRGPRYRK